MLGPFTAVGRRVAVAVVLVLAATAFAVGGSDGPDAQASTPYVALGDSYSSAPRNPGIADATCARSTTNYPSRLARALDVELTDVTCAGAQTRHVRASQTLPKRRGGGTAAAQIEAVGADTELVTVGLGGNDGGLFLVIVQRCLAPAGGVRLCLKRLREVADEAAFQRIGAAIRDVVEQVRMRAAPGATIVLVDYPRLVASARTCDPLAGVSAKSLAAVAAAQHQLNRTLAMAASDSDAAFLDLEEVSASHDLCSAEPWVNDAEHDPGLAQQWHPLPRGQAGVARLLEDLLAERGWSPSV